MCKWLERFRCGWTNVGDKGFSTCLTYSTMVKQVHSRFCTSDHTKHPQISLSLYKVGFQTSHLWSTHRQLQHLATELKPGGSCRRSEYKWDLHKVGHLLPATLIWHSAFWASQSVTCTCDIRHHNVEVRSLSKHKLSPFTEMPWIIYVPCTMYGETIIWCRPTKWTSVKFQILWKI